MKTASLTYLSVKLVHPGVRPIQQARRIAEENLWIIVLDSNEKRQLLNGKISEI